MFRYIYFTEHKNKSIPRVLDKSRVHQQSNQRRRAVPTPVILKTVSNDEGYGIFFNRCMQTGPGSKRTEKYVVLAVGNQVKVSSSQARSYFGSS